MDAEGGLQDDLILKILSFVGIKDAIGTSVLSPTWRSMWTSIPHLSFSSQDFSTMDKLYDFVTNVLSRRNNQVQLSSFKLYVSGPRDGEDVAQRIMNHAFSLNVQQVEATFFFDLDFARWHILPTVEDIGFLLSLLSSHTLKHLTLIRPLDSHHVTITSIGELPSLTTLHLHSIELCDGFFDKCPNLENLTLQRCCVTGLKDLNICLPRLSNLTLVGGSYCSPNVILVTPQLKNLTISRYLGNFQVYAPELASLNFEGPGPYMFSTDGFPSLEKAQLSMHTLQNVHVAIIISLLQKFNNVKHLTLTMDICRILDSSLELISCQPSPLATLKSLKILPQIYCDLVMHMRTRATVSTELKNYLLNGSPEATLTEVTHGYCCDEAAGIPPPFLII